VKSLLLSPSTSRRPRKLSPRTSLEEEDFMGSRQVKPRRGVRHDIDQARGELCHFLHTPSLRLEVKGRRNNLYNLPDSTFAAH